MGARTNFTREFKQSVVQQLGTRSIAEICREHNIHQNVIYRWKREYEKNPRDAFSGHGKPWKEEATMARYERLIGRQALEIDLLKKSIENLSQRRAEELRMRRSTK